MDQIVLNIGYLAAKKNNTKLRNLLEKFQLKDAIFSPEQLIKVEEAIKAQKNQQGAPTSTPISPSPAPRPSSGPTTPPPR